jgi:toxin HigB-1
LEVSFKNKKIREICEDNNTANKHFGPIVTQKLQNRIADLISANSIFEIIVGSPTEIRNSNRSYYQIQLNKGYFLLIRSNHTENKMLIKGNTDWTKVYRIMITEIKKENE